MTSCLPTGGALEDLGKVSLATREPKCRAENRVLFLFPFLPAIDTTGFEVVKDQNARSSRSKVDSIPNSLFLCISGMQSGAVECEYLGSDEAC